MINSVGKSEGVHWQTRHPTRKGRKPVPLAALKTIVSIARTPCQWAVTGVVFVAALWAIASAPAHGNGLVAGGPFWTIYPAWAGAAILAGIALLVENRMVRLASVLMFGMLGMGLLGYLEPYGVFHDSWRNVGLGQLSLDPQYSAQALSNSYVAGSPLGFVALGLVRQLTPDTATMLRLYPILTLLVYCPGIYQLALAFLDRHFGVGAGASPTEAQRVRFGLLSVLAFLSIASIFSVRVNPAPQSVAFAIMPFFLAAVLRGRQKVIYRALAMLLFGAIVLTHPITALMAALICVAFFASDFLVRSSGHRVPVVSSNTVVLYSALFVAWVIYIGLWVVEAGGGFVARLLSVLNGGQMAVTSASGAHVSWDFVWTHRVAMLIAGLLILFGLIMAWKAGRAAGARLFAWLAVSSIWLPFMMLGEFADRGPLFASLPASLSIAFALNGGLMGRTARKSYNLKAKAARSAITVSMVALAGTGFATAYPNHVGEVITPGEMSAFHTIAQLAAPDTRISYGYMPPLDGADIHLYATERLATFATGAADFSYERLLSSGGIIVLSENMRQAAQLRGTRALQAYDAFAERLQSASGYDVIYSSSFVTAYRVR